MTYPFVVIEGLDGTGKTTLRKGLFRLWEGLHGVTPLCVLTTNFLDPDVATEIVEGKYSPRRDNRDRYLAAVVADKRATVERLIVPALKSRPVIADRWVLSELAFFAVKHELDPTLTHERLAAGIDRPADLTFVLDVSPADSVRRAQARPGDATRGDWDVLDVQARVREIYLKVAGAPDDHPLLGDVVLIDAAAHPAEVLRQAWLALDERGLMPAIDPGEST